MLKKLKTGTIKSILRGCNEPTNGERTPLAREAALMLTMTSDEEEAVDKEDDDDDDAA